MRARLRGTRREGLGGSYSKERMVPELDDTLMGRNQTTSQTSMMKQLSVDVRPAARLMPLPDAEPLRRCRLLSSIRGLALVVPCGQ